MNIQSDINQIFRYCGITLGKHKYYKQMKSENVFLDRGKIVRNVKNKITIEHEGHLNSQ